MARQTFSWNPDLGARRSVKANVTVSKFGDGYEKRTKYGINTMPRVWDVTFTVASSVMLSIVSFLEARGGLEAFDWVDPMNQSGAYVCRDWQTTQTGFGLYSVTCKFEQVFEA